MKLFIAVALLSLGVASATCPNLCSQHGTCGENDRCTCFSNWQGADCSERVCPFGLAWVDSPSAANEAHWYAECSNAGVCDRTTGQCACHAGYEGKGCKRSSCPNGCSGHGTCYFVEELMDSGDQGKKVVNYGNWDSAREDKKWYDLWDTSKIQGCVCDPYYEGTDCSQRQCPRGDNKLTTGSRTDGVTDAKDQGNTVQEIIIAQGRDADAANTGLTGEFTLTFTDLYGGAWETDPIQLQPGGGSDPTQDWTLGNGEYVASRIASELENLPNQVVESVTVTSLACGRGAQHDTTAATTPDDCTGATAAATAGHSCYGTASTGANGLSLPDGLVAGSHLGYSSTFFSSTGPFQGTGMLFGNGAGVETAMISVSTNAGTEGTSSGAPASLSGNYGIVGDCLNIKVEFTGDQNAGVQNILQVNYAGCNYDGCSPQYNGIQHHLNTGGADEALVVYVEDVTTFVSSGANKLMHEESAICSEHGLCDTTTGLCNCFSGYYDEDCTQQTVLV